MQSVFIVSTSTVDIAAYRDQHLTDKPIGNNMRMGGKVTSAPSCYKVCNPKFDAYLLPK